MDPDATLEEIRNLYRDHDRSEWGQLVEAIEALDEWLARGGFLPRAWDVNSNH